MVMGNVITEWFLPVPDPKKFWKEFGSDSPTVVSEVPHTQEVKRSRTKMIIIINQKQINIISFIDKPEAPI